MVTYEMIKASIESLSDLWGEDGEKVVTTCIRQNPLNITLTQFLDHAIACGGNLNGMLLTGLKRLRPEVWEVIPNDMGPLAIGGVVATLILCGVDTTE